MQYTVDEIRREIFRRVFDVYEIFQNFFGEEYTDIRHIPKDEGIINLLAEADVNVADNTYEISQDQLNFLKTSLSDRQPVIMVWWPRVTVTNENDRSVEIQDLYAEITITMEGQIPYESIGFQLNRTTFTDIQFSSNYIHSHVPSKRHGELPVFQNPCLGRGPIKDTIADLKNNYEEALWMLFCHELSLYVTVESLTGVPYRKLEEIGSSKELGGYTKFEERNFRDLSQFYNTYNPESKDRFIENLTSFADYYLANGHFAICFTEGKYKCGMSYFDFIIDISNAFVDWFNQHGTAEELPDLYSNKTLRQCLVQDGRFFEGRILSPGDSELVGRTILKFKGQEIPLNIIQSASDEQQTTTLLNHTIAMFILKSILRIINYHYGNDNNNNGEITPSAYQTVYYI